MLKKTIHTLFSKQPLQMGKLPPKLLYSLLFFWYVSVSACLAQHPFSLLENNKDVLNYSGTPVSAKYHKSLMFSDKGAWFAYGFLDKKTNKIGFSGPFIMTEQNGVWLTDCLVSLNLSREKKNNRTSCRSNDLIYQHSYNSHLEQLFQNDSISIKQQLVYLSSYTVLQRTRITNKSNRILTLYPDYDTQLFLKDQQLHIKNHILQITSAKSSAVGYLWFLNKKTSFFITKNRFRATLKKIILKPGQTKEIIVSQSFIFPPGSWKKEEQKIKASCFDSVLYNTKLRKEKLLKQLMKQKRPLFSDAAYLYLLNKTVLTLQNNTRTAAGALKHAGLFPSYHYPYFHGFWAWDSWKQATAVVMYDPQLAKDQICAMFDYQKPDGFIPDCIFRDTLIEPDNYRNTKPPLAAWAVWKIFKQTNDTNFLSEMYPKLKAYHFWWYKNRDHDSDSLCEYGSTDGTLVAAKWESGMDNAVRFDSAKVVKNHNGAYSLQQESVDLNAYMYAEKNYLSCMANVLGKPVEAKKWHTEAIRLKKKIQRQFWDNFSGWFYDTNLNGTQKLSAHKGCEGYIPLWADVASKYQASRIIKNIMDTTAFNTFVPLPTLAANDSLFEPDKGYRRGPVWIDQSYFAIAGLRKYGYVSQANLLTQKLIQHASGLLQKGTSIRENYQPLSGKGQNAQNFSWSAAHLLLLLTGK